MAKATLDPYHNWRTPEAIERLRKINKPPRKQKVDKEHRDDNRNLC